MSAVSKKLMPASKARLMKGREGSSSKIQSRHFGDPYVMVPRQMRETFRPVLPRRTCSIEHTFEKSGEPYSAGRAQQECLPLRVRQHACIGGGGCSSACRFGVSGSDKHAA